jgi:hypothetical protein
MADATNREHFILMTVGDLTLDPVTKTPRRSYVNWAGSDLTRRVS